ncbi:MAG: hypothetical protein ACOC3V_03380 [bacterium]
MATQTQLLNIDFNKPTFKMVGGTTLDDIKIKYGWLLNAEVDNAIVGEDENGLVWYSGDWIGGIWENGTWYSGNFHDGRWKRGNWYSYDLNLDEALKGKLVINRVDISKSNFKGGTWEGGTFHYGIFGHVKLPQKVRLPVEIDLDFILNNIEDYTLSGNSYYDETYDDDISGYTNVSITSPRFLLGDFRNGLMNASKFESGNFRDGFINNSLWFNGTFHDGIFLGDIWYNGNFVGGDFSNGTWKNGSLVSTQDNIVTRFGINYKNKSNVTWENGVFNNGEFHSTLNTDDDSPKPSLDNSISHWENGTWENGTWYGGTFHDGEWLTGTFINGIVLNINWINGHFKNGFWKNGTMEGGTVGGGIFENINCINGNFGVEI